MQSPLYQYFVEWGITPERQQVNPLGADKLTIKFDIQENEKFFRRIIDTELTFIDRAGYDDYTLLKSFAATPCEKIYFVIDRSCNNEPYAEYWRGYCSYYDLKIDESKCNISTKFFVEDEYTCLLENNSTKINLLEVEDRHSIVCTGNTNRLTLCSDGAVPHPSPQCALQLKMLPFYSFPFISNVYAREEKTYTNFLADLYIGTDGWVLLSDNGDGTKTITRTWTEGSFPTPYYGNFGHLLETTYGDLSLLYNTNDIFQIEILGTIYTFQYVGRYHDWSLTYAHLVLKLSYYGATTKTYTRAFKFEDAINLMLSKICPDNTPEFYSRFFQDETNPVTGEINGVQNRFKNLMLIQNSDAKNAGASNPATKGFMTFQELSDKLRNVFNCYWYIDENGKFRVENDVFWTNKIPTYSFNSVTDIDLQALDGGKWIVGKNAYSFEQDKMFARENFTWQHSYNIDFTGRDIYYDKVCTFNRLRENATDYSATNIVTDIWYIQQNPPAISDEGFTLLATDGTNVLINNGAITSDMYANADLSWANLHATLWIYGRILLNGNMNGINTTFETAKKLKKQENISFQLCCYDFNPYMYILTDLGNGEIAEAEEQLKDSKYTVTLKYEI